MLWFEDAVHSIKIPFVFRPILDIHEVLRRGGNMQARNKTGHRKIDQKIVCRAHEKIILARNLSRRNSSSVRGFRNLAKNWVETWEKFCVQPGLLQRDIYSKTS